MSSATQCDTIYRAILENPLGTTALRVPSMCFSNYIEEAAWFPNAVNNPRAIESLVSAMLRIYLGEHEEFRICRIPRDRTIHRKSFYQGHPPPTNQAPNLMSYQPGDGHPANHHPRHTKDSASSCSRCILRKHELWIWCFVALCSASSDPVEDLQSKHLVVFIFAHKLEDKNPLLSA